MADTTSNVAIRMVLAYASDLPEGTAADVAALKTLNIEISTTDAHLKGLATSGAEAGAGVRAVGAGAATSAGGLRGLEGAAMAAKGEMSLLNVETMLTKGNLILMAAVLAGTAIKAGADWQSTLVETRNNTTMTDAQFKEMTATLTKLGSEGPASLADLAAGYRQISDTGYQGAAATTLLDMAMKSAVSTGASVADTAATLASVMHAFGASANQAAHFMDVLHLAANSGRMTLEEITGSMGTLGVYAASIGIPVEDVAAALATLTRNGMPAANATTQVKDAMIHIVAPAKQARDEIAALSQRTGVDLVGDFTQAGLAGKGLFGVMDDISRATNGNVAEMQKLIPNMRGLLAGLVLTGNGAKDYRDIMLALNDAQGQTEAAAKRSAETLNYQLGTLRNNLQLLAAASTQTLLPSLNGLIGQLRTLSGIGNSMPSWLSSAFVSAMHFVAGQNSAADSASKLGTAMRHQLDDFNAASKGASFDAAAQLARAAAIDRLKSQVEALTPGQREELALLEKEYAAHQKAMDSVYDHAKAVLFLNKQLDGAGGTRSKGAGMPDPPTAQQQYQTASSAYNDAVMQKAADAANGLTFKLKEDQAQIDKTRAELEKYQRVIDANAATMSNFKKDVTGTASKVTEAQKAYDALQQHFTDLSYVLAQDTVQYGAHSAEADADRAKLHDVGVELGKWQTVINASHVAQKAATAQTDALQDEQTALGKALSAAYDDVAKYGHILPEHQAQILADTQKITAMQDAVAKVTVQLENAQWSKFGPQELQQSSAITALQQANQIADNQLGLTSEQKAVIDAQYALQEAQHQVALDQLKLLAIIADPKHTKEQVADARATIASDQGAVGVAQSNLGAAQQAEFVAATKEHYAVAEQGVQSQIDALNRQSAMIALDTSTTAGEKAVLQASLAVQIDQKQLLIDQLKLTADQKTGASASTIAVDRGAVYRDTAKGQEDAAALANAKATEAATHYTEAWAKTIGDATTRVNELQAEVTTKIYDLAHGITDTLPPLSVLQDQLSDGQRELHGMNAAAAKAAWELTQLANAAKPKPVGSADIPGLYQNQSLAGGGQADTGQPSTPDENAAWDKGNRAKINNSLGRGEPSTFGLPQASSDDPGKYGGFSFGGTHVGIPSDAQIGALAKTKTQELEAAREQELQNQIDELKDQTVTIGQDATLTDAQKKIDQDILQIKIDQKQTLLDQAKLDALKQDPKATQAQINAQNEVVVNDNRKTAQDTGQLGVDTAKGIQDTIARTVQTFKDAESAAAQKAGDLLTITRDGDAIQIAKLNALVTATQDQTAVISAQTALATAKSNAATTAITDQTSIMAATYQATKDARDTQRTIDADLRAGDSAKAAIDSRIAADQMRVDQDAIAVARAKAQADEEQGAIQIKIAEDGVKLAEDKLQADASAAKWQQTILQDQLNLDTAKYALDQDEATLQGEMAQSLNTLVVQNGAGDDQQAAINGTLDAIHGDNQKLIDLNGVMAADNKAASIDGAGWAQQQANDAKQQALDQASLAASQGNWGKAIALLQQAQEIDSETLSTDQSSLQTLQDVRAAAQQQLQLQGVGISGQKAYVEYQKAMIDANKSLTDDQKAYQDAQLQITADNYDIQSAQLQVQEAIAGGGDPLAVAQASLAVQQAMYKLSEDTFVQAQLTTKAVNSANSKEELLSLIDTLERELSQAYTPGARRINPGGSTLLGAYGGSGYQSLVAGH